MKLSDVVRAILIKENVSDTDLEKTVLILVQYHISHNVHALRRIVKKLNFVIQQGSGA